MISPKLTSRVAAFAFLFLNLLFVGRGAAQVAIRSPFPPAALPPSLRRISLWKLERSLG